MDSGAKLLSAIDFRRPLLGIVCRTSGHPDQDGLNDEPNELA